MGAPKLYYVDPSLGSDTGDGSVDTPWGRADGQCTQHALDTITPDATDGDQINVKSGAEETLDASLTTATYGTPTSAAPLIIRGYNSTAGDIVYGTQTALGDLGGASTRTIISPASLDYVHFQDMHLHDCGAATIIGLDNECSFINCEFDGSTGGGISSDSFTYIQGCHFHNIGGFGVTLSSGSWVLDSYFSNGATDFGTAIRFEAIGTALRNIFSLDGASNGIMGGTDSVTSQNSIYSPSGTGSGILVASDPDYLYSITGNLVDGFNGAGGKGIVLPTTSRVLFYDFNAVNGATTPYDINGDVRMGETDNETLGATPYAKSGADSWANRFIYFAPVDTGSVHGGGFPNGSGNIDKGAVQHTDAGGSLSFIQTRRNAMIGR